MRIRMLSSQPASPDGINVALYRRGEKYDLPEPLAQMFLGAGQAEEDKDLDMAPEVKAGNDYQWPWGNEATANPVLSEKKTKRKRK